jgi:hypothetical protein
MFWLCCSGIALLVSMFFAYHGYKDLVRFKNPQGSQYNFKNARNIMISAVLCLIAFLLS